MMMDCDGGITMECDLTPPRKPSRKTKVSHGSTAINPPLIC
jgi:hypothetical protein